MFCGMCGQRLPAEEGLRCSACGAVAAPGNRFCMKCGSVLSRPEPAGEKCSACGAVNSPEDTFCMQCGSRLKALPVPPPIPVSVPVPEPEPMPESEPIPEPVPVPDGVACSECGTVNAPDSLFCLGCGKWLKQIEVPEPAPVEETPWEPVCESEPTVIYRPEPKADAAPMDAPAVPWLPDPAPAAEPEILAAFDAMPEPDPAPAGVRCPDCGAENGPDDVFCMICGKWLKGSAAPTPAPAPAPVPGVCPKCGTRNDGEARFCQGCGLVLRGDPVMTPPQPPITPLTMHPMTALKSPTLLIAAILLTLAELLPLVIRVDTLGITALLSLLSQIEGMEMVSSMLGYAIDTVANTIGMSLTTLNIILALPQLLVVLGLWLAYGGASAHGPNRPACTGGLRIIQVIEVLNTIKDVVLWIAVLVLGISLTESWLPEEVAVIVIVLAGVMLLVMTLLHIAILGTIGTFVHSSKGKRCRKASGFVIFLTMAGGILTVLGALASWVNLMGGVANILLAATMIQYNGKVSQERQHTPVRN